MPDIITRNTRVFRTSGLEDSYIQAFYNNNFVIQNMSDSYPNVYVIPDFSSNTGTFEFYEQTSDSIFLVYARPYIRLTFTGDTSLFTGDSRFRKIVSSLYKIDYTSLQEYRSNKTQIGYNTILDKIQTPLFSYSADSLFDYWQFYDNFFSGGNVGFTSLTEEHSFQAGDQIIVYQYQGFTNNAYEGVHTISAITDSYGILTETPWAGNTPVEGGRAILSSVISSGITFDFYPDQLYKPKNQFTQLVFEDRAQYFFNISYLFANTGQTYVSTFRLDENDNIVPFQYSSSTNITTIGDEQTITQGDWSGNSAYGLFFTCFTPPNKPIIEFPFPATAETGQGTFTPIFNFSNVEDGDKYVLQITYDMTDSGFTQTLNVSGKTSYPFNKDEAILEEVIGKTDQVEVGTESTTTKKIRRLSIPIKPGFEYWYRIGNIKSIVDIFGVERRATTYSEVYSGFSSSKANIELGVDSKIRDTIITTQSNPTSGRTAFPQYTPGRSLF